jgi:hypothetical protein
MLPQPHRWPERALRLGPLVPTDVADLHATRMNSDRIVYGIDSLMTVRYRSWPRATAPRFGNLNRGRHSIVLVSPGSADVTTQQGACYGSDH